MSERPAAGAGNIACLGVSEIMLEAMGRAERMGATQSEIVLGLALVIGAIIRVQVDPVVRAKLARIVWADIRLAAGLENSPPNGANAAGSAKPAAATQNSP